MNSVAASAEHPADTLAHAANMEIIDTSYPYNQRQIDETPTPVQQFFSGTNVFITGGTGFLGKSTYTSMLHCSRFVFTYLYRLFVASASSADQQNPDVVLEREHRVPAGAQEEGQRRADARGRDIRWNGKCSHCSECSYRRKCTRALVHCFVVFQPLITGFFYTNNVKCTNAAAAGRVN